MDLKTIFSKIDSEQDSYVEDLIKLANINSHSFNQEGLKLCQDFFVNKIQEIEKNSSNLKLKYQNLEKAIRITKESNNTKATKVLLMGHLDTVYSMDSKFQKCTQIDSNTLNGPGVSDLKGGLIVMLNAIKYFESLAEAENIAWEIFLNHDEEIGSLDSAKFFPELAKRNDLALIFEPTLADGSIAYRRKGTGSFYINIHGKSAHVGRNFDEGINAILIASELAQALYTLNSENLTVNLGKITGGGSLNVVPDYASLALNIRINNLEDGDFFEKKLVEIISVTNKKFPGAKIESSGSINRKPKIPNEKTDKLIVVIREAGKELGLELALRDTGGCCDGNNLHELGLTNIDTLGVRGGKIHSPEEYVLLDSIPERIKLLVVILSLINSRFLDDK